MRTIERATAENLQDILSLLNNARDWLHANGVDQWPNTFIAEKFMPYVMRGGMWLVKEDGQATGCMRLVPDADPAFWTEQEASQLAMYLSRMAVASPGGHTGLGGLMLRWALDHAHGLGYRFLRLDCRRDNARLRDYYSSKGLEYLRTVEAPGRLSGALFQTDTRADPDAREALAEPIPSWLPIDTRVTYRGQPGRITGYQGIYDDELTGDGWKPFGDYPAYVLTLDDGQAVTADRREVAVAQ